VISRVVHVIDAVVITGYYDVVVTVAAIASAIFVVVDIAFVVTVIVCVVIYILGRVVIYWVVVDCCVFGVCVVVASITFVVVVT